MRILLVVVLCVVLAAFIGYGFNIVKLCQCDFSPPYKAEVIRCVGVAVPPFGAIVGYVGIEDGNKK